jgi:aerobic carbon-monoxide dehydrogenase large subunit
MPASLIGSAVRRTEDAGLLTGQAHYVEDLSVRAPAGTLHASFVRAVLAHARIEAVGLDEARTMPGVAGVFTAADLDLPVTTSDSVAEAFARPMLAADRVRYVGEPIAVVLAATRAEAVEAAEAVWVELEPLPVVVDPELAAAPEAPLLFEEHGSNVALEISFVSPGLRAGHALDGAEVVVRGRFVNQRLAPAPMEVNGGLCVPGAEAGTLDVWLPVQAPFWARDAIAEKLGLAEGSVRVVAPHVGGGFGAKIDAYPEHIVIAALAHRLGRPIQFVETRSENMTAMTHGRGQVQDVALGATRDGEITGLRVDLLADLGAYPGEGSFLPDLTRMMLSGVYRIPRIEFTARAVATNTTPIVAYRGAGRPEAAALIERAVDMLAQEIGMDPAEIRRRNFIPPESFPFTTATEAVYDSGEYARALDRALDLAGYEQLRKEQAERRAGGNALQLGIGISTYVEVTGWGSEFGSVEVQPDGVVTVTTGVSPQGQGHETAWAQLVSSTLRVPMEAVQVVHSDTARVARGNGTMGSRSLQVGGSSALEAAEAVVGKARRLAAHLLEAGIDDIELSEDGRIGVVGAPDRAFTWAELAEAAEDPGSLPAGFERGLRHVSDFELEDSTFPFGVHVSVVEVDTETGFVRPLRHVAVDDCGRILNPMLAEGQVHGGTAQGMAQALYEEVLYDEDGNPLTANLMSYEMPSAADLPSFETAHTETPTSRNPLGAKGIGESGTIGSTPAVQNAVIDAVAHLGVRHIDMPLTPERVWRAIREAEDRRAPEGGVA